MVIINIWKKIRLPLLVLLIGAMIWKWYPSEGQSPELTKYYKHFKTLHKKHCKEPYFGHDKSALIQFKKLKSPRAGECRFMMYKYEIDIDPDIWALLDNDRRYELMMHELSHCEMPFLTHVDNPNHYMYESLTGSSKKSVKRQMIQLMELMCSE